MFSQLEFMRNFVAISDFHKVPMLLTFINPNTEMEAVAAVLQTKDA